jgi:adenylate kinase
MLNVFIEGIPGSGKSTLLGGLQKSLPEYNFYYEGDISPIELAWCSYMTSDKYKMAIEDWPQIEPQIKEHSKREDDHYIVSYTRIPIDNHDFYSYMAQYESLP